MDQKGGRVVKMKEAILILLFIGAYFCSAVADEFMFGINTWDAKADSIEHLKALGVKWYAPFLHWRHVHPGIQPEQVALTVEQVRANPAMVDDYIESCDWERFDGIIRELQENGFSLFPIAIQLFTDSAPKLDGKAVVPHPPDTPMTFTDNPFQHNVAPIAGEHYLGHAYLHMRAVVRRYKGITHWMVDPEINQSALFRVFGGWKAGRCWADWEFVTAALRTLTQAVKDERPDAKVCLALNTDQPPAVTFTFGRNPLFAGPNASIMDWPDALSSWLQDDTIQVDLIGVDAFESQGTNNPHCYERLKKRIETAVERAQGKPVVVASLGCPSGPEEMGWTEAYQETYVREAFKAAVDGGAEGFFYFKLQTPDRHGIKITPLDQKVTKRAFKIFKDAWQKTEVGFAVDLTSTMLWLTQELAAAQDDRDAVTYLRTHFFPVLETAETYWGLVRPDGTHKGAFNALRDEFNRCSHATSKGR